MSKYLIILIIIVTTSCVSTKRIDKSYSREIQNTSFSHGRYSNCPKEGCSDISRTLLDQLTFKFIRKDRINDWQSLELDLKKGTKALEIEIYRKDSLISTQHLRGKWKNNVFYSKRMIRPIGVPFIYYWYYEKKIILKWNEKELILSNGESKFGMIFIINAGVTDYNWAEYEKLDTANSK